MNDENRFQEAIQRIDAANREDPNLEDEQPKELLYGQRMSGQMEQFAPDASQVVRLAARAQHICRWRIPRSDYPQGRDGYRKWRTDLGRFHAQMAGRILSDAGYEAGTVERVEALLRKERLKSEPDCQLLEDVICLVFLQHYLEDFAAQHKQDKLIRILRRTWKKMSQRGREAALQLELAGPVRELIEQALGTAEGQSPQESN